MSKDATARVPSAEVTRRRFHRGEPQFQSDGSDLPLLVVARSPQGDFLDRPTPRNALLARGALIVSIVIIALFLGGLIGLYRQPPGLQWAMNTLGLEPGGGTSSPIAVPAASPAMTDLLQSEETAIIALGRLMPSGKIITVAPASGFRDAPIGELRVAEGDHVERGQILAVLENISRLASAVASARATVALREAAVEQTKASVQASLEESRALLARAEAVALRARQDFSRTEQLYKKSIVSPAAYDEKIAALRDAEEEVERQKATVSRYAGQDLLKQPDVLVALRNVDAAAAELKRATQDLEQAYIRAPISGTVLEIKARTGEKPGDGGVLELGNLSEMTAELDVYQSQIGKVAVGDAVTLTAAALPQTLKGKVSRVGLKVKRQSTIGQDPAANTDARVVEVIVALDAPSSLIASRFTDLQVEARIKPEVSS